MSVYADGHDQHEREGADTRYIELCWRCAKDWLAYVTEHPDEAPLGTVVLAIRPSAK